MRVQETAVHCLKCKHEWMAEMIVEAPIEAFLAVLKAIKCPSCFANARSVALGRGDVPNPEPVQSSSMTDAEKRLAWLRLHDNGLSSECIADVMCGMEPLGNHPHDGDDFGRCERLLMLYPEWREQLAEMAAVSKIWAALVARWGDIAEAWAADCDLWQRKGRKAELKEWRCYDLMRSIIDPLEKRGYMREEMGVVS